MSFLTDKDKDFTINKTLFNISITYITSDNWIV